MYPLSQLPVAANGTTNVSMTDLSASANSNSGSKTTGGVINDTMTTSFLPNTDVIPTTTSTFYQQHSHVLDSLTNSTTSSTSRRRSSRTSSSAVNNNSSISSNINLSCSNSISNSKLSSVVSNSNVNSSNVSSNSNSSYSALSGSSFPYITASHFSRSNPSSKHSTSSRSNSNTSSRTSTPSKLSYVRHLVNEGMAGAANSLLLPQLSSISHDTSSSMGGAKSSTVPNWGDFTSIFETVTTPPPSSPSSNSLFSSSHLSSHMLGVPTPPQSSSLGGVTPAGAAAGPFLAMYNMPPNSLYVY